LLIGVVSVKIMRRSLITFSSIVGTLAIYDTWFSTYLKLRGRCVATSKSYFIVGLKGKDISRRLSWKLF